MQDLESLGVAVLGALTGYLRESRCGLEPVVSTQDIDTVADRLELGRWLTEGGMSPADLMGFVRDYCEISASHHHPGYMAHQIAPPDVPSVLADLINGVTNNIPLIYELAPAGTAVDRAAYTWMLEKAGWSRGGTGTLTHGGTLGNLTAMLAARAHAAPGSWRDGNPQGLCVIAPEASHYSLRKAAAVMGLGENGLKPAPVDALGRLDVSRLPQVIAAARARGQVPFAVVANACATATGLHDDVAGIGRVCRDQDLWFHVDGAHGASALISPELRQRFAGLELANSLTWDTHKMLRTSGLCTGVLFRDASQFQDLFLQDASYLFQEDARRTDMGQRTFETSKPPLGLRLFLNLAYRGEASLRQYVEAQYAKAEQLWHILQGYEDFDCPYRPETNILCFRYAPAGDRQQRMRDDLRGEGHFYLSTAKVGGVPHLRASIMSPATDETALRELAEAIVRIGRREGERGVTPFPSWKPFEPRRGLRPDPPILLSRLGDDT